MRHSIRNVVPFITFASILSFATIVATQAFALSSSFPISMSGQISSSSTTYFKCTFSRAGASGYGLNQPWPATEPCPYRPEQGTWHWVNCGPTDGTLQLVTDPADSARLCLNMLFSVAGTRPLSGSQQVKLYEVQSRESSLWGEPYPTLKEAYWSMEYWFPSDLQTKEWRLIWQMCGEEYYYVQVSSYPQLQLTFGSNYLQFEVAPYYYSNNNWHTWNVMANSAVPKGRWVPIVVYMKQGSTFRAEDGTVIIWIDGVKVFENHTLPTATPSGTPYEVWSIGNYGSEYELQGQYIDIRNVLVTSAYPG